MPVTADAEKSLRSIYIPHWLDSMRQLRNRARVRQYLHSTLVRFYAIQKYETEKGDRIYIPHWLDSMGHSSISITADI